MSAMASPMLKSPSFRRRLAGLVVAYALAYLVAAGLDLATTVLALQRAGASEGNVHAAGAAGYSDGRAWAITLVMAIPIGGLLLFGALNADKVAQPWLERPVQSFARVYVNPFARGVIDRSPLHMLSFVLAFPLLRVLAAANNGAILAWGIAPLGWLVGRVGSWTTPLLGFWVVIGAAFYVLTVAVSPAAAAVIRRLKAR
jgi:hypothetical protein